MSVDERSVALPKLYGAPAYARPPALVPPTPRPFDPDQLPLQVFQTEEERRYADLLPAHRYAAGASGSGGDTSSARSGGGLRPKIFTLRGIAGRLFGGD